jgi:phosphoribosyl-ATP pyrophosphohydrolase/phosphoribosyl-AMP cyclohydrolase
MTDREIRSPRELDALVFSDEALIPVVAQDARGGRVLMVAFANREALERTLDTGVMHFWSRSRRQLWRKGETSGNALRLRSLHADCDSDTLLALVEPTGPACHTGEITCFGASAGPVLPELWETLVSRAEERPGNSYTARLLEDENLRIKKVGEEATELVLAIMKESGQRQSEEAADLLYHLLVALLGAGNTLDSVLEELEGRRK